MRLPPAGVERGRLLESRGAAAGRRRRRRRPVGRPGRQSSMTLPAIAFARVQRSPRHMLALVSISTAIRRWWISPRSSCAASRRNGRANAKASRHRTAARSKSRSKWSRRLRRVSRGRRRGQEHQRAERQLAPGVRRIRWNTIGAATASIPRIYRGVRKLIAHLPCRVRLRRPGRRPRRIRAFNRSNSTNSRGRSVVIELVFDTQVHARPLDIGGVRGEPAQVFRPRRLRVDVELAAGFHIVEHRRRRERETHLGRVEDPQDDHVVPARTQVAQPGPQGVDRGQQVGDQDDQTALADRRGDLLRADRRGRSPGRWARDRASPSSDAGGPDDAVQADIR